MNWGNGDSMVIKWDFMVNYWDRNCDLVGNDGAGSAKLVNIARRLGLLVISE